MLFSLSLILLFLALSAVFSATEAAILSASPAKIHKLSQEGNKKAAIVQKLHTDKEKLIGTILLGNNLINVSASALATDLSIEYFGDGSTSLIVATTIMTILIVIYGELLPKTLALRNPEYVSLKVSYMVYFLNKLCSPFVSSVKGVVNLSLQLLFRTNKEKISISGLDTIKSTIDIQHKEGEMDTEDKFMLGGIIDLETMSVDEIMIHRNSFYAINIDDSIPDILKKAINSPFSRIPIYKNNIDEMIGILHVRDISKLLVSKESASEVTHEDIIKLLRKPWFIPNSTNLKTQLFLFREKHYHFALVVNEYGELQGLVTLEDIVEEVVGQIDDEYDRPSDIDIKLHRDGSISANGDTTIRDVNREANWQISDEAATTIGGLLFHLAKKVPELGEKYTYDNYTLKLVKKKKNKILKVRVYKNA